MKKLEALDGYVVLKLYQPETSSKLVLPENVSMTEYPTFEVVHVGKGRQSQHNGERQEVPLKEGDRVLVPNIRAMAVTVQGEKLFIVDWVNILARVW